MSRKLSPNWHFWTKPVVSGLIVILVLLTRKDKVHVPPHSSDQGTLSTSQAKKHIGENGTVCGTVVSSHYGGGSLTYIYLDKDFPSEEFRINIWSGNWDKFSPRPNMWKGKYVCVTGLIEQYHGAVDITATSAGQIRMK